MKLISLLLAAAAVCSAGKFHVQEYQYKEASEDLLSCVKNSLQGDLIDYRIVTPDRDEWATVTTGVIVVEQSPAVVVYAKQIDEVPKLVDCGVSHGYGITPRSGAHHFENWSALNGTLVIDISHISYVLPSEDLETAVVGGGARLGAIYTTLGQYDKTFLAGICPSVALGGYIGVGGYNVQMRKYGLAVDWMESAKVVLADGTLINTSETENPDLWFAIRGGGTYGIIVEATLKIVTLPRSSMVYMHFPAEARYEGLKKYIDWSPHQAPEFNSQINLYGDYANVVGWYIGGTVEEMETIVNASGIPDIEGVEVIISGNCSTENSRNYWMYTQETCTNDTAAEEFFWEWYNVIPDDIEPMNNITYGFDDVPAMANQTRAKRWPHISLIDKAYFKPNTGGNLTDDDIAWIVNASAALPTELGFWAEITTFNLTSAPASTSSFPWFNEAQMLFRFEVKTNVNATLLAAAQDFIDQLDVLLRGAFGNMSYAGYVDADITTDPQYAYWGDNVAKLSEVKGAYDPFNVFSNPFSIDPWWYAEIGLD